MNIKLLSDKALKGKHTNCEILCQDCFHAHLLYSRETGSWSGYGCDFVEEKLQRAYRRNRTKEYFYRVVRKIVNIKGENI